jgi:hypothetical protein
MTTTQLSGEKREIEEHNLLILRIVPFEYGFHFTTDKGVYSGLTANSLEDFAEKLRDVDVDSVTFHYYRGDFQRWIDNTLGDTDFANKLCFIDPKISGEQLRKELLKMLDRRIHELKGLEWVEKEGL